MSISCASSHRHTCAHRGTVEGPAGARAKGQCRGTGCSSPEPPGQGHSHFLPVHCAGQSPCFRRGRVLAQAFSVIDETEFGSYRSTTAVCAPWLHPHSLLGPRPLSCSGYPSRAGVRRVDTQTLLSPHLAPCLPPLCFGSLPLVAG